MCMLFIYCNSSATAGEYRLVVVNVRDEYWDRPTASAHFWGCHENNISGIDQRGGGTWFGVSKAGKIGSILNVLEPFPEPSARSRGALVSNFLNSSQNSQEYLTGVCAEINQYNQFNLVLMEINLDLRVQLYIISNWQESSHYRKPTELCSDGVHVFGNCRTTCPWSKVKFGESCFTDVINRYKHTHQRGKLIDTLEEMLHDRTRHLPDPELYRQGSQLSQELKDVLSCVNVYSAMSRYGSRTHTIFLMDGAGECEYIERTMDASIDSLPWSTTHKTFRFHSNISSSCDVTSS